MTEHEHDLEGFPWAEAGEIGYQAKRFSHLLTAPADVQGELTFCSRLLEYAQREELPGLEALTALREALQARLTYLTQSTPENPPLPEI
jgi:hypothetical protein